MSDILTKKIYSKDKTTGVETQVYPETNPASIVGLQNYVDGRITTFANTASSEGHLPLTNFDFDADPSSLDGTYTVISGTNSPVDEFPGTLSIYHDGNGETIETWTSASYTAHRKVGQYNPITANRSAFTVNGVKIDPSIIRSYETECPGVEVVESENLYDKNLGKTKTVRTINLRTGSEYTLSGALTNVRINIVGGGGASTKLILNNVYVHFNDEVDTDADGDGDMAEKAVKNCEPMINCVLKSSHDLIIELAANSRNYFVRDMVGSMESVNTSSGVIFDGSDPEDGTFNMTICGTGYLSIYSMMGGHAIKAKGNLIIDGDTKIRATAYHDILHGNQSLTYKSGHVYCDHCNDFFGADTADGDNTVGTIIVYSGDFTVIDCTETFLQGDDCFVYPGVTIKYKDMGEGLWLQCDAGTRKIVNATGQCSGFYTIDYAQHRFDLYKFYIGYDFFKFTPAELATATFSGTTNTKKFTEITGNNDKCTWVTINGVEYPLKKKIATAYVTHEFRGINVYEGVTCTQLAGGTYKESIRNTCILNDTASNVDSCKNGILFTPNRTFSYATLPNGFENEFSTTAIAQDYFPAEETFAYSGTVYGGVWNVGVNQSILAEYKTAVDKIFADVSTMIIPPKTLIIKSKQDYTDSENPGEVVELKAENPVIFITKDKKNNDVENTAVAEGVYQYTTKLVAKYPEDDYPTLDPNALRLKLTLHPGEVIRINAVLDPENTTNTDLKWSVAGKSEVAVIGRLKEDDIHYCQVCGLQPGYEEINVSAKAKTKKYEALKYAIGFTVVESNITFDANGGTGTMAVAHPDGISYILPECEFTAPESQELGTYDTFCGWLVNGELLEVGTTIEVKTDTLIKAAWGTSGTRARMLAASPASGEGHTVSFAPYHDGGNREGKGTMTSITGIGGAYALPECEFEPWYEDETINGETGYWSRDWDSIVFNGWSLSTGTNNEMLPAGIVIEVDADTVLTANFGPANPPEPGM